jgi:protein-disulfide isomerase
MKLSKLALVLALFLGCGGATPVATPPVTPLPLTVAKGDLGAPPPVEESSDDDLSPIPISAHDPTWGARNALVTIVVFSDFQCPYCGRVEPTLAQVRESYGPEKLRIVWKNQPLPFHWNARPAAEAAQGVFALGGDAAFWKFHDAAFRDQRSLSPASYEQWAADAGVDVKKLRAGLAAHTWDAKIERDMALATALGANGTPSFFINGSSLVGAQPLDQFKSIIDLELKKAEAKLAAGTPRGRLYAVMSEENRKLAPKGDDHDDAPPANANAIFKVPVGTSPVRGPKNALVTIIEFSDFQCPYCKRAEDTLKKVLLAHPADVRIVWKNEPLPFHPRAEPAAELAYEALAEKGETGFWATHDKIFDSQPKLEDADLDAVASALGLNLEKVHTAIKTHKYKATIEADSALADDFEAVGTPHFFINGKRLTGAQPLEKFEQMIADELVRARAEQAKGTAPAALYEALVKGGSGPPEPEKKSVTVAANAPARGNLAAKVTIQEFSDFQCPFCKRAEDALTEVMKNYGTQVKFVWRHLPLPFHANANLAAQASMEVYRQKGAAGFWRMHDLLFQNQGVEHGLERAALDGYAKQLGLDLAKWQASLDTGSHKAEVEVDEKAAKDAGINGTPTFLINGYVLSGAHPYPQFKKLIDRALAESAGKRP